MTIPSPLHKIFGIALAITSCENNPHGNFTQLPRPTEADVSALSTNDTLRALEERATSTLTRHALHHLEKSGVSCHIADMVTFGSLCTAFRNPRKKSWKSRAQVGVVIGRNDVGDS